MSKKKTPLDEFTKLLENPSHNLLVEVYTENKGRHKPVKKKGSTINQRMDKLEYTINDLVEKIENFGNDLSNLRNEMNTGFKQVNSRLDYIVKANDLKDRK